MISAAVAAIAGILIAPIVPLVPISYTLFIVPALAAAVLGRFQYVIPAVARWARHRDAAVGGDVLPEPAHLVAELGPARAHPAGPDPPGAGRSGQAAPESRRHPAAHARPGAAPAAHPRADGAGNRRRRARAGPAAQQLARRDGDELHLRHHLPVARRRDRLRRPGVAGPAHPGRRRRVPARDADDGVVDPVPDRAHPRGARRDGRRCGRRSPGPPRPRPLRRRGDARPGLRRAGGVVPQLRLRPAEGRDISGPKLFGLDLRSRVGTDYPRLAVLPRRARRAGDRRGVRRVAATQPARLRHARGSRQRALGGRRRHQRRPGEDPRVRHRRVHRRARRRDARLQAGQPHVRPVRRPDRPRRVRHRLPRRDHVGLRRHPRRDARGGRHRLLRDHPMARPGRLVRDDHRRRPRAHGRAQPGRHRRPDPRHAREDADPPRHHGRAGADAR